MNAQTSSKVETVRIKINNILMYLALFLLFLVVISPTTKIMLHKIDSTLNPIVKNANKGNEMKKKRLEPFNSAKLAGYQNHAYVIHGLSQLDKLEGMVDAYVKDATESGDFLHIELAFMKEALSKQRASLHMMNKVHDKISKLSRNKGYRDIDPDIDWLDKDGDPLGFGGR